MLACSDRNAPVQSMLLAKRVYCGVKFIRTCAVGARSVEAVFVVKLMWDRVVGYSHAVVGYILGCRQRPAHATQRWMKVWEAKARD